MENSDGSSRASAAAPSSWYSQRIPSLEPYVGRLERFELFSTNQCYYIVGSNKLNSAYRIIKIDRTLIEKPSDHQSTNLPSRSTQRGPAETSYGMSGDTQAGLSENGQHTANPTLRPLSDFLSEDPNVYSQEEIKDMLDMIHDGNRMTRSDRSPGGEHAHRQGGGGLKPIVKAYGIVGFIRFLDCYYLTLITKRAKVGSVGGNGVYTIKNTETIPLKPAERSPVSDELDPSSVLLSMWNRGKRSVGLGLSNREIAELRYQGIYQVLDLSKSFFFSYTYDLTRSLQENFFATTSRPFPPPPFKDIYAWNYFLTREFESCLNSLNSYHWVLPIIHGAYVQRKVNDYGRSLDMMLIARRSRHFAGTRYLKRGVSDQGKVANDVEHEQIIEDSGSFSSFIQVRGSIPTFWTQESSVTMPKPPIELNRVDPTYRATQLHFEDLFKRYASPILVLDLVKQSEKRAREVLVGNEYRAATSYLNMSISDPKHRILYCSFDYSHTSKHRQLDVSSSLSEVSTWAVNNTGFFCSNPKWKMLPGGVVEPFSNQDRVFASLLSEHLNVPVFPMEQTGVLRTNCIDCLDRTNVAQFSAGVEAISQQLVVMGIRSQCKLDPSSNIVRILIDMYVDIGDSIALQYGGSEAHKKVTANHAESNIMPIGKHKELLTSIRRYYSNAFTDRLKQDAINLFLGYYVPYRHSEPLWEMETDYYLHNFQLKAGQRNECSMGFYRHAFGVDWTETDLIKDNPPLRKAKKSQSSSFESLPSRDKKNSSESERVVNVRRIVASQNQALSVWWKRALRENLQQRMWMKLRVPNTDFLLPPRYDRLYQPEKIAQFDRFFARGWATPLRNSHNAQHTQERIDESDAGFTRVITQECASCLIDKPASKAAEQEEESNTRSIGDFVDANGFDSPFPKNAKLFVSFHDRKSIATKSADPLHLENLSSTSQTVPPEYIQYCKPSSELFHTPYTDNSSSIEEFKESLRELSLDSNDVDGIRQLSESGHLNHTIFSGPYRGLSNDESAIEFTTALQEQFNAMESASSRSTKQIEAELRRRGFDSAGVTESVQAKWSGLCASEQQYKEMTTGPDRTCRRSDLTTSKSLKCYMVPFDRASQLSKSDVFFLSGRKIGKSQHSSSTTNPGQPTSFAKRAARLGIDIGAQHDHARDNAWSLFPYERRESIPTSFEQINEDLFARRDNKFMVFNGPGIDSWHGSAPVTKVLSTDNFFLL